MDGKLKQGRRCRTKREKVRMLRETLGSPDPGSPCSDREGRSPGRDAARKAPHPAAAAKAPRCSRRKRLESSSQEEDIIDGFAITSFITLDRLERTAGVVTAKEKKERWKEKGGAKRQKNDADEEKEEEENVQPAVDPLENGFLYHAQRAHERLLKKTYSKKNKTIKPLALCPVKLSEDEMVQGISRPHRSNTKEQLSEVQAAAVVLLKCDSESDIDNKVSDVGSERLFSSAQPKGLPTNESSDSKTFTSTKVSKLQRSQEQNTSGVPFAPPVPSPIPASAPTGSPALAAAAAPPDTPTSHLATLPLCLKREQQRPPPAPTPPLLRAPPHSQHYPPHPLSHQEPCLLPSPQHQTRLLPLSHQLHHPLHYNSLHDISSGPVGLSKQHLPPSPHHHLGGLPSSAPALPLSIANLSTSHYSSLRSPAHRHSAMFATPATLPPPPTLPTNSLVVPGHPTGTPYPGNSLTSTNESPRRKPSQHELEKQGMPEHDLLRQELNNRFLVQSSERGRGPSASPLTPVSLLRPEFHQHQHMHQHQHTHQHTFTPFPASLPPAAILTPPTAPPMFDKYTPKLDNPFIRHSNFFPSYPPTMPGMPPLLPHSGPFSSLQGAFQPKASNTIDVAGRPGAVPHTLLHKDPRITDPFRTSVRKPGKWCAVHVQIAWQIYHHQQKMKQMQLDSHKLDMNSKLDLFSRPAAPGVFPGFPYPHDLARPLFSSTGSGHPAPSPYGPVPHPSGFLPPSHLADPFSRSSSFGGLGNLSSSAFGGLGNPSLGSNSVFSTKEGPGGLHPFGSPHHDTWNRLRRTPPSFPTPPQWPKTADIERSNSANSHEREREREREREKEREREREKRDSSIGKEQKDKDRDSVDRNRHSNRSSPASAPVSYQISSLIRSNSQNSNDSGRHHCGSVDRIREAEKELLERHRESFLLAEVKVKESHSPGKEMLERRASEDSINLTHRSPSPYSKAVISEQALKMAGGPPSALKDGESKEPPPADLLHRVKNDMKIKEERKEEHEVMVVSSEQDSHPPVQALSVSASQLGNPHHHHPPLSQQPHLPSPRCSDIPAPGLHGVPMAQSLPLSMSAMPQMGSLNVLDRARMAPFMGVSPLAGRERIPHTAFPWDPLREAYRSLDLQRRMDFQLRAEQGHRFPSVYEQERAYREREAHDYSHHEHLLEVRREHERMRHQAEERERLHLREELDRARLHQLHQSPMEGHLPHMPSFMPHIGGMPYPRLSPSTGHSGPLNRTPPTAALSAPPPLVPAGSARPSSPRRTTPLTQDSRDYSPSRNPKEVEAR